VTSGGAGISGATMMFTRVSGSGALPSSVWRGSKGNWSQSGFESGTLYRVTPSKRGYTFNSTYLDFSSGTSSLNFTGLKTPRR